MKKILLIVLSFFLMSVLASTAGAWQIELSDAYAVGNYWAYDVSFAGEVTDNLNRLNVSVGYDVDDVEFAAVVYHEYDDGASPFPSDTWVGGMLPYTDAPELDMVFNLNAQEPLGTVGVFFPVATGQTNLFTLYFQEIAGSEFDDTSVYFTYGWYTDPTDFAVESVTVNNETYDSGRYIHELKITDNTISHVPVPAAAWLLGSGILAMAGIRGKKSVRR